MGALTGKVLARVTEEGQDQAILLMLLEAYLSNWLKLVRPQQRAPRERRAYTPSPPVIRRTPAVPPSARREAVLSTLDARPIRIPTLKSDVNPDGVVAYGKMDQTSWGEFIRFHERQSRGHATVATWGRENLTALTSHGARTMAELPTDVKHRLLTKNPIAA